MDFFAAASSGQESSRIERLKTTFKEVFEGQEPSSIVRVPGRVNLIGEHIDYCGYSVHPMAIDQDVLVAVAKRRFVRKCVSLEVTSFVIS